MREVDGMSSGGRSFGRLCLALIPWALGIGASVWLGVYIGVHQFRHELSQEERAAIFTGAQERPKQKIAVHTLSRDCTKIVRADLDGDSLTLYAENDCGYFLDYMEYHWEFISPNGTILNQGYHNGATCPIPSEPRDKAECSFSVDPDDRAESLKVWASKH